MDNTQIEQLRVSVNEALIAIQDCEGASDYEMLEVLVHEAMVRILGGWDGTDAVRMAEVVAEKLVMVAVAG
jgi:hypothetical protein